MKIAQTRLVSIAIFSATLAAFLLFFAGTCSAELLLLQDNWDSLQYLNYDQDTLAVQRLEATTTVTIDHINFYFLATSSSRQICLSTYNIDSDWVLLDGPHCEDAVSGPIEFPCQTTLEAGSLYAFYLNTSPADSQQDIQIEYLSGTPAGENYFYWLHSGTPTPRTSSRFSLFSGTPEATTSLYVYPDTPSTSTTTTISAFGPTPFSGTFSATIGGTTSTTYLWDIVATSREHPTYDVYSTEFSISTSTTTTIPYSATMELPVGTYDVVYRRKEIVYTPVLCQGTFLCGSIPSLQIYEPNNGWQTSTLVVATSTYSSQLPVGVVPSSSSTSPVDTWISDTANDFMAVLNRKFPINYLKPIFDFLVSFDASTGTTSTIPFRVRYGTTTYSVPMEFGTSTMAGTITIGDETKTFGEWCRIVSDIVMLVGFFYFSYYFLILLFANQVNSTTK